MKNADLTEGEFRSYYQKSLGKHGADSAEGVGYRDKKAQYTRFKQLMKVVTEPVSSFTINDLGCGSGGLLSYMKEEGWDAKGYTGYDVLPEMIEACISHFSDPTIFRLITDAHAMIEADYSVCSGIFNLRNQIDDATWKQYLMDTITLLNQKSKKGFAFNMLTKYSDADRMEPTLYYADPCFFFDYCKKNFSRNVALLHDYEEYDFTIIVRK